MTFKLVIMKLNELNIHEGLWLDDNVNILYTVITCTFFSHLYSCFVDL